MLDFKVAKEIEKAVREYCDKHNIWIHLSLEDICRMQVIPSSSTGEKASCTVLGLQKEELTILARVTLGGDVGIIVRDIDIKDWS